MKRLVGIAVIGLLAGAGTLWLASGGLADDPVAEAVARRGHTVPIQLPAPLPTPEVPAEPEAAAPAPEVWEREVGAVRDTCGLAVQTGCSGERCVSLTTVPPLDHPSGWLAMARRSPRLVASVIAGDLGLPDRALPCRDAIRSLGRSETLARTHDGGEVWCLAPGGVADGALCDQLAAELLGVPVGFEEGPDRRVELRPPR